MSSGIAGRAVFLQAVKKSRKPALTVVERPESLRRQCHPPSSPIPETTCPKRRRPGLSLNSFTERGSLAPLKIGSQSGESLRTERFAAAQGLGPAVLGFFEFIAESAVL